MEYKANLQPNEHVIDIVDENYKLVYWIDLNLVQNIESALNMVYHWMGKRWATTGVMRTIIMILKVWLDCKDKKTKTLSVYKNFIDSFEEVEFLKIEKEK